MGERHGPRGTMQQRHAKLVFQLCDAFAHKFVGNAQALSCSREGAAFHYGDKALHAINPIQLIISEFAIFILTYRHFIDQLPGLSFSQAAFRETSTWQRPTPPSRLVRSL